MVRRFIVWILFVVCGTLPACAVVDPSDEDKIQNAIASLRPEQREKLRLLQRRLDMCQHLALEVRLHEEDMRFTCYEGKKSGDITFGPEALHDLCSTWNGEGRLREHMQQAVRDFLKKNTQIDFTTCVPNELGEEVFAQLEHDNPQNDPMARIVELLLLGAIPAAVLTVVAPELLPVLCLLGRDVYCADDGTLLPPGPLPVDPSLPPDTGSP